jgi:hypothetical protein
MLSFPESWMKMALDRNDINLDEHIVECSRE